MEFEGSCPQDTVGLVVLKGLSLSASTRENLDLVVVLTDTVHALIRTSFVARLMAAVLGDIYPSHSSELKVHLQIFPHKSERWKHGSTNFQKLTFWQQVFELTDTVPALIRTSFAACPMATVSGTSIYPAIIPCWLINFVTCMRQREIGYGDWLRKGKPQLSSGGWRWRGGSSSGPPSSLLYAKYKGDVAGAATVLPPLHCPSNIWKAFGQVGVLGRRLFEKKQEGMSVKMGKKNLLLPLHRASWGRRRPTVPSKRHRFGLLSSFFFGEQYMKRAVFPKTRRFI
ncbi:hypothetical protein NC653_028608 [Populus alba x Populus x berolinensis]|uniref:Uncharacterized protein n=1 Tax=Populus alba x Populus x berolinensis TaxID=444605 RepID=A0AAD6M058_9ROSI|nr:hypothetical protein NC653_028608 [Populus alba x Populus x berolinensis]